MSTLSRFLGELLGKSRKRDGGGAHGSHLEPMSADALFRRGVELSDGAQFDLACDCYRQLLRLDPLHGRAYNNLGIVHQRRGEIAAATQCFNDAARVDPLLAEPHVNLGNLHELRGDPDAAAPCYRRALQIDPGSARAHCSLAQALLATGQHETGWEEYEWRWNIGKLRRPPFSQPHWDGSQDIAGQRILLYMEQGFGDAIQFIRYAPMVAARNAKVIVICDEALRTLFQTVRGVDSVVRPARPLPEFEYQAPLMSLPRAFRTTLETIPDQVPYIFPEPHAVEAWRAKLSAHTRRLKVGIAWAGRPSFVAAGIKACPVDRLAALVDTPGCAFFSLQKGEAAVELDKLNANGRAVADYTEAFSDFGDTAAFICALDLVISIDTAAAHLAGALGKPVWLLLAAAPDWRWLPRGGAARWYPTATLFKQGREGDWEGVMAEVRRSLLQRTVEAGNP